MEITPSLIEEYGRLEAEIDGEKHYRLHDKGYIFKENGEIEEFDWPNARDEDYKLFVRRE